MTRDEMLTSPHDRRVSMAGVDILVRGAVSLVVSLPFRGQALVTRLPDCEMVIVATLEELEAFWSEVPC